MLNSKSPLPSPGRLFLPGCAVAAGLLAVSSPVIAAPTLKSRPKIALATDFGPMTLRVGKTATYPLPPLTTFTLESGAQFVYCEVKAGTLTIRALEAGQVRLRLNPPKGDAQVINLRLIDQVANTSNLTYLQVVERAATAGAVPTTDPATTTPTTTLATPTNELAPTGAPATASTAAQTGVPSTVPLTVPDTITGAPAAPVTSAPVDPASATSPLAPVGSPSALSTDLGTYTTVQPAPSLPALTPPVVSTPLVPPVNTAPAPSAPNISPSLPAPARNKPVKVNYRTTPRLPQGMGAGASGGRSSIKVTQGLARLLSFPSNILAVFFSDPNVMDARAINARTIAVTGIGPGPSTLAVFTSQGPNDAIGRANIYRIETVPRGAQTTIRVTDPSALQDSITSALGDPRIRVAVLALPDGSQAARLSGAVRDKAEVEAAVTTASFYVPRVFSSLYVDPNAPSLEAVMSGSNLMTPESGLQDTLRRLTGNDTIELTRLPTGLAFKAVVDSPEEAQSLLRVLPNLNQQIVPFIVVRGQTTPYLNPTVPFLQGEDRQLTQKLQDVTGISTVYAVRASSNGLACYGSVHTRAEYDSVRRYMLVMAQSSAPAVVQGSNVNQGGATLRPQGIEDALPSTDPVGGYKRNLGLQMFVRITDPGQSVIRKVTVETSVVEISRTALKHLGVEYGSASVTDETRTVTPGTTTAVLNTAGNPVIDANGNVVTQTTPATITGQPTVSTNFNAGQILGGNGFLGQYNSLRNIDPFRARLNALINNGDARLLSRPNVTSIEGAAAQITIGGERPIPIVVATNGALATQVEFRRYGVIISMRPTVTNDNTIVLQIRADITAPDLTYAIAVNGSLVPGEIVRSIDTTLNVRPGDTVVMGGLITNEKRQTLSKVPILSSLPIIGSLFTSKQFTNNETELAIFMSPHIELQPADVETLAMIQSIPAYPALPGRQENGTVAFEGASRGGG